jgi:hypothetical protein
VFGRLLNTLQHRLAGEESEWRSENRLRGQLQPRAVTATILRHAERPVRFGLCTTCLVSVLTVTTGVLPPSTWGYIRIPVARLPDLGPYFATVWAVQAAVVALVYPIVIGFVALLLERQTNAKSALHIYLHFSAAQLAGLSAMLLVAVMGLQSLAVPYAKVEAVAFWLFIDTLWFVVNIGLTIFFLKHTFDFIRPGQRFQITRRYAITIAWPREIRYHLAKHIVRTAVGWKLMPGPMYGEEQPGEPSLLLGYPGAGIGESVVTRDVSRGRRLVDVRFRILSYVARAWLTAAKSSQQVSAVTRQTRRRQAPVLAFPADPFSPCDGETTLCAVQGQTHLSGFQALLVELAFKFGKARDAIVELSILDILTEAQGETLSALRSAELGSFRDSVERLIDLYVSLLDASRVRDVNGGETNLALVPDGNHVFSRPLYEGWSRRLLDIFEAAAGQMSASEEYVCFLTHVPNRLYERTKEFAPPELQRHFVALSPILLNRIEAWWVATLEQQGTTQHGPCTPAVLRSPFYGIHDHAIREFVSSWESLRTYHIFPRRDARSDWTEVQRSAVNLEAHLAHTLVMLFDCILRGDSNAAQWLGDVLIKWYADLDSRLSDVRDYFLREPPLFTFEMMFGDWAGVEERLRVESYGGPDDLKPAAVLSCCLRNLWIDVCCIALYALALWNKSCECEKSLAAQIFAHIRAAKPMKAGGPSTLLPPYDDASDLLIAILRQQFSNAAYRTRLDGYVERISGLSEGPMVSGRLYSRMGANDLDSLSEGQLLTLLVENPRRWRAMDTIKKILAAWSADENESLRAFQRTLDKWKARLPEEAFRELQQSYDCLRNKTGNGVEWDVSVQNFAERIDNIAEIAATAHAEALAAVQPSPDRLRQIAHWASSTAFEPKSAIFPLPLFSSVRTSTDLLEAHTLVINGMQKGELTEPPMAITAANEDEWFGETMRLHVGGAVLRAVLSQLTLAKTPAGSPEAYWARLSHFAAEARKLGVTPILLLENPTLPNWIYEWAHPSWGTQPTAAPDGLRVTKDEDGKDNGYLWSINEIAVFNAPIERGNSLLMVRESFDELELSRARDHLYVNVETRAVEGHPDLVDLVLTWHMRVRARNHPALLLEYGEAGRVHTD